MHPKTTRCEWVGTDPLYVQYHDQEWGVPLHDDRKLFEFLILEGVQAGLNWLTVLKKRQNYRAAFADFYPEQVACFSEQKIRSLLADPGLIRNHLKIRASIQNARAFLAIVEEFGSFDSYIWKFVNGRPIRNAWRRHVDIPSQTPISNQMSKELRKKGFAFVGPTICYAFMQAVGMVNDHTTDCFRYALI